MQISVSVRVLVAAVLAAGVSCAPFRLDGDRSTVGDSRISILTPPGWRRAPVYTEFAPVYFRLPPDPATGGTPAYPCLSVERVDRATDLASYPYRPDFEDRIVAPTPALVAGYPAIEFAERLEYGVDSADFTDDGAGTMTTARHLFVLQTPDGIFECQLEASDESALAAYLPLLKAMCASMRSESR